MNAIFTLAARNYFAHAKCLGDSVKKHCPEVDFFIFQVDKNIDNIDLDIERFTVINNDELKIPKLLEMAFKYDVIEFSTSLKPFAIEYLFKTLGYEKILYIDPDMILYSSPMFLYDLLDNKHALLTPHLIKPYINYEGATTEEELLFVGIYNLGFFGVKNSDTGNHIVKWWQAKLLNQCFADKEDALHVDQKWMDFLPSLYTDSIEILRHSGINVAFWNFHERNITTTNELFTVDNMELVLFHFSGLVPEDYETICRKQTKYNLSNKPELRSIFEKYVTCLNENGYKFLKDLIYSYNQFDNGEFILKYQRRLFRGLLTEGHSFANPFSTSDNNSLYRLFYDNKLLAFDKTGKLNKLKKSFPDHEKQFKKLFFMMNLFKKIIGIKNYYLMMRFIALYYRFEKQTFLVKKQ